MFLLDKEKVQKDKDEYDPPIQAHLVDVDLADIFSRLAIAEEQLQDLSRLKYIEEEFEERKLKIIEKDENVGVYFYLQLFIYFYIFSSVDLLANISKELTLLL